MLFLKNIFKSPEQIYQEIHEEKLKSRKEFINEVPEIVFPKHWRIIPQPAGCMAQCPDSLFEISVTSTKGYFPQKRKKISLFLRPNPEGGAYWYLVGGGIEGIATYREERLGWEQYNAELTMSPSLHTRFELSQQDEMLEIMEKCFNSEIE